MHADCMLTGDRQMDNEKWRLFTPYIYFPLHPRSRLHPPFFLPPSLAHVHIRPQSRPGSPSLVHPASSGSRRVLHVAATPIGARGTFTRYLRGRRGAGGRRRAASYKAPNPVSYRSRVIRPPGLALGSNARDHPIATSYVAGPAWGDGARDRPVFVSFVFLVFPWAAYATNMQFLMRDAAAEAARRICGCIVVLGKAGGGFAASHVAKRPTRIDAVGALASQGIEQARRLCREPETGRCVNDGWTRNHFQVIQTPLEMAATSFIVHPTNIARAYHKAQQTPVPAPNVQDSPVSPPGPAPILTRDVVPHPFCGESITRRVARYASTAMNGRVREHIVNGGHATRRRTVGYASVGMMAGCMSVGMTAGYTSVGTTAGYTSVGTTAEYAGIATGGALDKWVYSVYVVYSVYGVYATEQSQGSEIHVSPK
ncbi:hypothetical protein BD779DRAFT_1471816 [Infundibulicybe gibba]|nr:hypothetical protein BD779DRAFT_1471816 [Infundibulicybe gibba]